MDRYYYAGKRFIDSLGNLVIVITYSPVDILDANAFLSNLGYHCILTFGDVFYVCTNSLENKDIDTVRELVAKPYNVEDIRFLDITSGIGASYSILDLEAEINATCSVSSDSSESLHSKPQVSKKVISKTFFDPEYFVKGNAYRLYFKDGIIPSEVLTADGVTEIDAILFEKIQPEDGSEVLIFQYLYKDEFYNIKASADAYKDNMVHIVRLVPEEK